MSDWKSIQAVRFYDYLRTHTVTCTQASRALGIPQKNLTWYKRQFEKQGLLWEVARVECPITGHWAWTISTDPEKRPECRQLNLFEPSEKKS